MGVIIHKARYISQYFSRCRHHSLIWCLQLLICVTWSFISDDGFSPNPLLEVDSEDMEVAAELEGSASSVTAAYHRKANTRGNELKKFFFLIFGRMVSPKCWRFIAQTNHNNTTDSANLWYRVWRWHVPALFHHMRLQYRDVVLSFPADGCATGAKLLLCSDDSFLCAFLKEIVKLNNDCATVYFGGGGGRGGATQKRGSFELPSLCPYTPLVFCISAPSEFKLHTVYTTTLVFPTCLR